MSKPRPGHDTTDNPQVTHETSDVSFWGIIAFGVVLAVAAIVVHVGIYWLYMHFEQQQPRLQSDPLWYSQQLQGLSKQPRLEGLDPYTDVDRVQRPKEKRLENYGWVDEKAGVAFIPIQEAITLLTTDEKLRLPSRKPAKDGRPRPDGWQWPSDASSGQSLEGGGN